MAADGTPGAKGNPQFLGSGAPATAVDLNLISKWAADHIGESVPTAADLPASGNWYNRTIRARDTGVEYLWNGSGWEALSNDTAWIVPTLLNSWAAVAGYPVAYRRWKGMVLIRGQVTGGATGAIFNLPVGFRPDYTRFYAVLSGLAGSPAMARVSVEFNTGAVTGVTGQQPNIHGVPPFIPEN